MRDYLLDIVQHTHSLGTINLIKVTGTESETVIDGIGEDRIVILRAEFHNPIPEFIGTFGMPNLNKLNTILNIPVYKEDAKITVSNKVDSTDPTIQIPDGIHFENNVGDFKNDYRLMSHQVVSDVLKPVKFKGAKWGVEIQPTNAAIHRMKFQAQANNEETHFIAKTENNNLVFYFGDHSSHAGNFVFANDVTGSVTKSWKWPINAVIGVLGLSGDKTIKFSDDGAAQITVDSGLAVYTYTFPANT
jgi:hypothetical protein